MRWQPTAYSDRVDLDAYVLTHQHEWARLNELASRRGKLTGAEGDELLDLYQRVATHLSEIRTRSPEPTLVAHLSSMLATARLRSAGTRTLSFDDVTTFFTDTFPAALYRLRAWWLWTMAANVVVAWVIGAWFVSNPSIESALISPTEVDQLINNDFESYYSEYAAGSFALKVWTNNAWVSALCIALGVLGLPVILLLLNNILNVALIGGLMWAHGRADLFFGLILPHGMLELTAVFVAAGVGLRIFWSWIEPGPRRRLDAVAHAGRTAMSVALGLAAVLLVSGIIEAFVTPSPLPTWARVGIGFVAWSAFMAYVFTVGRWAARRGATGDVTAADAGDYAPVVG